MNFISGYNTDVGIKKSNNEDSMLLLQAETAYGNVVFAVVCDGMGGLAKGEVASCHVAYAFYDWFKNSFPKMIESGSLNPEELKKQWSDIIHNCDDTISRYGAHNGCRLGTTLTGILIFDGIYYVLNIGDSRVYLLADMLYQITHDHTVVQDKLDRGLITIEQALVDPQRSVLLQCIGCSDYLEPDFFSGPVIQNETFLVCCDGFRHQITPDEIYNTFRGDRMNSESDIETAIKNVTEMLKARRETDNITAILVKVQ